MSSTPSILDVQGSLEVVGEERTRRDAGDFIRYDSGSNAKFQ